MQKYVNLVDLVKSFPTSIYLQKSASIQPRTSLSKFGGKFNSLIIRLLNRAVGSRAHHVCPLLLSYLMQPEVSGEDRSVTDYPMTLLARDIIPFSAQNLHIHKLTLIVHYRKILSAAVLLTVA